MDKTKVIPRCGLSFWTTVLPLAAMLVLSGCGGETTGTAGPAGPAGPPGTPGTGGSVSATKMTATEWANSQLTGQVTGASVVNGRVVVNFTVTDALGNGVSGLGNTSTSAATGLTSLTNLSFALGKLVPADPMAADPVKGPSRWVSYIVTTAATPGGTSPATVSVPTKPTTENNGTLVDNGDGTYVYTFDRRIDGGTGSVQEVVNNYTYTGNNKQADLDDVSYAPNLTHRVGIHISGAARGTGTNTANGVQTTVAVNIKTPANVFYDFVPGTGRVVAMTETDPTKQRNIVDVRNCLTCHSKFTFHGGMPLKGTGGSRQDTRMCVLCHTDQRKYGVAESTVTATTVSSTAANDGGNRANNMSIKNLPVWIHKIHMGEELIKTGYNPNALLLNEFRFPQDVRNCTKCHSDATGKTVATGTTIPQADNWKNSPSRLACGACHDGINFVDGSGYTLRDRNNAVLAGVALASTTPSGHVGRGQSTDSGCPTCHLPGAMYDVDVLHMPVAPIDPANANNTTGAGNGGVPGINTHTNTSYVAGYNSAKLPAGAIRVSFELKTVVVNAAGNPELTFRFINQNLGATSWMAFNAQPATPDATVELMANFIGGPSAYVFASMPQDGVAAPADFNVSSSVYIRNCWNGTLGAAKCTMTAQDASGYTKLTMTGVKIPATATMVTGGIGFNDGSLTEPLNQINLPAYPRVAGQGGLNVPTMAVTKLATNANTAIVYTARRAIVESARCNTCHNSLGVFAKKTFHGGQRNDAATCAVCHTPDRNNNGWSVTSNAHVHAIHSQAKRTADAGPLFSWLAVDSNADGKLAIGVDQGFFNVGYPGILRNCQQCHLPNTVNFGGAGTACTSAASSVTNTCASYAANNLVFRTVAASPAATAPTYPMLAGGVSMSPYVNATTSYGAGYTATTWGTTGVVTDAADTTLVNSPIANACFSCHTTSMAKSHMTSNGGVLYKARADVKAANGGVMVNNEQCLICHGAGRVADVEVVHSQTMK